MANKVYSNTTNRIYIHHGSNMFDPKLLLKDQSEKTKGEIYTKRNYDLWASPFNDQNASTWESFRIDDWQPLAGDALDKWVLREAGLRDADRVRFVNFLIKNHNMSEDYFYGLSHRTQENILKTYDEPVFQTMINSWRQERQREVNIRRTATQNLDQLQRMLVDSRIDYRKEMRDNSFCFTVDQSKIFHVYSMSDIKPFLDYSGGYTKIAYDKLDANGYSGIELHNSKELIGTHSDPTIFTGWDIDSIAIWDPSCVKPVEKEIAYISRMSSCDHTDFDLSDPKMDKKYLTDWIKNNPRSVNKAISAGILLRDDVTTISAVQYETEPILLSIQESSYREIKDVLELEKNYYEIPLYLQTPDTPQWDLAKYCYENDIRPFVVSDMVVGTSNQHSFTIVDPSDFNISTFDFIGKIYDCVAQKSLSDSPVVGDLSSLGYFDNHVVFENGNMIIESKNGGYLFTTLDISKEIRELMEFHEKYYGYEEKFECDLKDIVTIMQVPETIRNPKEEYAALRESLAARCIERGIVPWQELSRGYHIYSQNGNNEVFGRCTPEPGMIVRSDGIDLGTIVDVYNQDSITIIETDKFLITNRYGLDCTKEYNNSMAKLEKLQFKGDNKTLVNQSESMTIEK